MFNRFIAISIYCLFVFSQSVFAETRDPGTYFFNDTFGNFQEELQTARDEGKKGIMIMFMMDDCPYCHRMLTTVLNQKNVQQYYRDNFLIFQVDIEGDIEMTDFKGKTVTQKDFSELDNRVRATPVFAFFDLEGNRVARYIGATPNVDEFMLLGHYVADGKYKGMSFTRYKRKQAAN
jgi:thioredoxin-related protein